MKQIFRTFTRAGYVHAAKPLMFRKSPDAVHRGTVGFGRKVQRIPLSRQLIAGIWQHSSAMLSQQIHGLTFPNPVGLSAGFDKNAEAAKEGGSVAKKAREALEEKSGKSALSGKNFLPSK